MPAAPSLEKLFDTQAVHETAMSAYLTANGLADSFTSKGGENMPDSRVECQYVPGAAQGHQATRGTTNTGETEQDMFAGMFNFRVITERAVVAASPVAGFASVHDYRVARLKVLMLRGAINGSITGITALSLPYHRITALGFSGQTPTIEEDAFDVTELGYATQSQILPDAWPAAVTP